MEEMNFYLKLGTVNNQAHSGPSWEWDTYLYKYILGVHIFHNKHVI